MARAAAAGVGGDRARVRLFLPEGRELAGAWPSDIALNGLDRTIAVSHQGESVGEIAVGKGPGDSITEGDEKLLADLASQAGLALKNLRLTAELEQSLKEIRQSRSRIVAAQDAERRRMERDIHDGAQQQLVSLAVKLALAKNILSKDPNQAAGVLAQIKEESDEVLESIRDLARGIFPPLLGDRGLVAALESHVAKMQMEANVEAESLAGRRFEPEVEAAVYFTVREGLQNASKHAPESRISISLYWSGELLVFTVNDQGPGFDMKAQSTGSGLANMRDRIEAIEGEFKITSSPGHGTTVEGRVPVKATEPAA
jgi:signal transduction histidine kinase